MSREFPKNNPPENIALPTVGRIVHVFGITSDGGPPDAPRVGMVCGTEPGQLTINAAVWTRTGDSCLGGVQNLPHASLPRHTTDLYWDWMDFQKGQAAKTEQLQRELEANFESTRKGPLPDTSQGNKPSPKEGFSAERLAAGVRDEMGKLQAGAPSPADGKR